ncbi:hypothetical protein [Desulfuribacillus alkaliarsenatis]|uniref:Tetrahaem cytochrome domain-containing protein n=1 Tax=Desulfuribacillus alkaliarsenatis TaxID=766136 RepID=A0A1E5G558_9FIRM|nr:hypothetical protein [Desulfuribacillus alkaliarsenatis]OEF98293.1 hypothetical protein BHF68_01025 [Desulfuribacillus alkaliarsenatis]
MDVKRFFLLTLILALMAFTIVACGSTDEPAPQDPGDEPPIDEPPGEVPNGEQPGQQPNGEQPGGDQPGEQPANAGAIPHALDGVYENCMQCHSDITATHEQFGDFDNCTACHQPQ